MEIQVKTDDSLFATDTKTNALETNQKLYNVVLACAFFNGRISWHGQSNDVDNEKKEGRNKLKQLFQWQGSGNITTTSDRVKCCFIVYGCVW